MRLTLFLLSLFLIQAQSSDLKAQKNFFPANGIPIQQNFIRVFLPIMLMEISALMA